MTTILILVLRWNDINQACFSAEVLSCNFGPTAPIDLIKLSLKSNDCSLLEYRYNYLFRTYYRVP